MRTSLIEIQKIENWLLKRGDPQDRLVTEARLISSPEFKENARWQEKAYQLVHLYGREKLLEEINAIEYQLFHTSKYKSFQDRVRSIFKR